MIHLERLWADNRFTAEGDILHLATDRGGMRRVKGVRRVSSLPLACERLNLVGIADLVEFHAGPDGETPFPVEFKRGKPKKHRADEVQLCAQGLCLEEMTGQGVPAGALFYGETRRRVDVAFDAALRRLTEETALALAAVLQSGETPGPTPHKSRCRACSLLELCRPQAVQRSAKLWRGRALNALLSDPPEGEGTAAAR